MLTVNKVILIGPLVSSPQIRSLNNGCAMSSFQMTTSIHNKTRTQCSLNQAMDRHNIVLFGKLATISGRCFKRGSIVYIEGRLKTRCWPSSCDQTKSVTEVIGYTAKLLIDADPAVHIAVD